MSDTSIFSKEKLLYIINKYDNIYLYIYIVIGLFVYFKFFSQSIDKKDEYCDIHKNISLSNPLEFYGRNISRSDIDICFLCIIKNICIANNNDNVKKLMLITELIPYKSIKSKFISTIIKKKWNNASINEYDNISVCDVNIKNKTVEEIKEAFNYNFFEKLLKSENSYVDKNSKLFTILDNDQKYKIMIYNLNILKKLLLSRSINNNNDLLKYKDLLNKTIEQITLILTLEIFYYDDFIEYKTLIIEITKVIIELFNIECFNPDFNVELANLFVEKELINNYLWYFYKDSQNFFKSDHKCIFSVISSKQKTPERMCLLCRNYESKNHFDYDKDMMIKIKNEIEQFDAQISIKNIQINNNDDYDNNNDAYDNYMIIINNLYIFIDSKNIYIYIYYYYYYKYFNIFIENNSYDNFRLIKKYFVMMSEVMVGWFNSLKYRFRMEDKNVLFFKFSEIMKAYLWSVNIDIIASVFDKIVEIIADSKKNDWIDNHTIQYLIDFILLLFNIEYVYYNAKYRKFKKSAIKMIEVIINYFGVMEIKTSGGGKKTNKEKYKILVDMCP